MAKRARRRKCKNCEDLFLPDHRNRKKQKYCSKAQCRAASKKASQDRWRQKKENLNYFSGPDHVKRVQEWRKSHPGYGKKKKLAAKALQDHLITESIEKQEDNEQLAAKALQDLLFQQSPVIIGLIANLTGNTLQDDIAQSITSMKQLGSDILNGSTQSKGGSYDNKTSHRSTTYPKSAGKIQLGGSPSGP